MKNKLGHEIGKQLHSIADFYSHSNYIELYIQAYGIGGDINSIPTFQEVFGDTKYEKFAARLIDNLKTGIYPGKGKGSHNEMNLMWVHVSSPFFSTGFRLSFISW